MEEPTKEITYGGYQWQRPWWTPAVAFFVRNWHLYRRYLAWIIVFWTYSVINTLTVGLIGKEFMRPEMVLYLVIGSIIWAFLGSIFEETSEVVSWEQWEGTMEYTFMAPISRLAHLLGVGIMAVTFAFIRSTIIFIFAVLFFKIDLGGANIFGAMLVLAASCLPFLGIGMIAATFPLMAREKGQQATYILQSFILLVSGVFYDISVLPPFLQKISVFSPGTYSLRSIRAAILHGKPTSELWGDITILIVSGIILIPLGYAIFRMGERYAKKNGKLKKSG
jgi:ABC-2 type transport system permease protein